MGGFLTAPLINPLKPPNPFKPKEIFATTPLGRILDKKKSSPSNAVGSTTNGTGPGSVGQPMVQNQKTGIV